MPLTPREILAAVRRQEDFDQLMLEMSGFIGGVVPRFLRPEHIKRIRQAAGLTLDTSLSDRSRRYIEMMEDIWQRLASINRALDRAMERAKRHLEATQAVLEEIRARATVTADGRRAYRTEDRQRAFYDDGQELTAEEISKVRWREGAPSWEQRQAAGEAMRQAKQAYENLEAYKARADYYSDRMASGDALSEDDLKDMKADLDAMPEGLRAEFRSQRAERAGEADAPAEAFTFSASDLDEIAQTEAATKPLRPGFPSP